MKRREFLQKTALAVAGTAVMVSGAGVIAHASSWTGELKALSADEGETLLAMTRRIFPHDHLDDSYYVKVVEDLDAAAAATPDVAKLLHRGVADLDAGGAKFVKLTHEAQVVALKKIDDGPFFQKIRGVELVSLYNNHDLWKRFGYQGASYPIGGYLHHGFNDLKWLPDPPAEASPKPA